jgi:hypothetical protein
LPRFDVEGFLQDTIRAAPTFSQFGTSTSQQPGAYRAAAADDFAEWYLDGTGRRVLTLGDIYRLLWMVTVAPRDLIIKTSHVLLHILSPLAIGL